MKRVKRGRGRPTTESMRLQSQMAVLERAVIQIAHHTAALASDLHVFRHGGRSWNVCVLGHCGVTKAMLQKIGMTLATGGQELVNIAGKVNG